MNSLRFTLVGFVLAGLASCATPSHLDRFADRVTTYNREAELAQDRSILLNILRASKRRPLTFFELQTVSAQGTPSAGLGFSVPLAENGSATPSTISPSLALSGGPTVAAGYINTQEFYQGILKPIPTDTLDYFIQRGISDNMLFNLFFSRVVIRPNFVDEKTGTRKATADGDDTREFAFNNYPSDDNDLNTWQTLIETLLNAGLTTHGAKGEAEPYGPPLLTSEVASGALLAKAATAKLQVDSTGWCDLTEAEQKALIQRVDHGSAPDAEKQKVLCKVLEDATTKAAKAKALGDVEAFLSPYHAPPTVYRLQKPGEGKHVFCLSATRHNDGPSRDIPADLACEEGGKGEAKVTLSAAGDLGRFLAQARPCQTHCTAPASYDVEFTPRSTYGVIYYLGEITRRKLTPDPLGTATPKPRVIDIRVGSGSRRIPHIACSEADTAEGHPNDRTFVALDIASRGDTDYECKPLFNLVRSRGPGSGFLSVSYDGYSYSIPDADTPGAPDGGQAGLSAEVLDIVAELIALNRNAKDAPTSSLVTLVGAH